MLLRRGDVGPTSMLERSKLTPGDYVGGAIMAVVAHALLPLSVFLATSALSATIASSEPQRYTEEHVVEARFVRLGKKKDPTKLPDRVVPRKSTAPDESTVVSKNMNPEQPDKPDAGPRPERPEEDLLKRFGDLQPFAEIADMEREGDPEGIEDGTETEAQVGDLYRGKLVMFFKKGWTIPTTLGDTSKLVVVTTFEIRRDLKVGSSTIEQGSGEPLFDQSVEDRFQQLRTSGATLPEPPPEVAHQFVGQTITVRFRGQRQ
jgi:hypothetical protein